MELSTLWEGDFKWDNIQNFAKNNELCLAMISRLARFIYKIIFLCSTKQPFLFLSSIESLKCREIVWLSVSCIFSNISPQISNLLLSKYFQWELKYNWLWSKTVQQYFQNYFIPEGCRGVMDKSVSFVSYLHNTKGRGIIPGLSLSYVLARKGCTYVHIPSISNFSEWNQPKNVFFCKNQLKKIISR